MAGVESGARMSNVGQEGKGKRPCVYLPTKIGDGQVHEVRTGTWSDGLTLKKSYVRARSANSVCFR